MEQRGKSLKTIGLGRKNASGNTLRNPAISMKINPIYPVYKIVDKKGREVVVVVKSLKKRAIAFPHIS
jgi:uncharacterized protein YxjI